MLLKCKNCINIANGTVGGWLGLEANYLSLTITKLLIGVYFDKYLGVGIGMGQGNGIPYLLVYSQLLTEIR